METNYLTSEERSELEIIISDIKRGIDNVDDIINNSVFILTESMMCCDIRNLFFLQVKGFLEIKGSGDVVMVRLTNRSISFIKNNR